MFGALTAAFAWNVLFVQPVGRGAVSDMRGRVTPIQRTVSTFSRAVKLSSFGVERRKTPKDKVSIKKEPSPSSVARNTVSGLQASYKETDELRRAIQRELRARGYAPGLEADGTGLITRAAIMAFEYDIGVPMMGLATEDLFKQILFGDAGKRSGDDRPPDTKVASTQARDVMVTVQQSLRGLGYNLASVDGKLSEDTASAIRDFEADQNLPETGRVSGRLIARLARLASGGQLALGN